ncbi:MAG: hypothetical protein AAF840_11440, partial [Bacteroidota bacterium]
KDSSMISVALLSSRCVRVFPSLLKNMLLPETAINLRWPVFSSTLINGVSLKTADGLTKALKKSVLSTFIDDQFSADPRVTLSYNVQEKTGHLRFIAVSGNSMFFNRDGKTLTQREDNKATLIIDESFAKVNISDPAEFCLQRLNQLPGNYTLKSDEYPQKSEFAGLEVYELYALDEDKDEALYLAISPKENGGYYVFVGIYQPGSKQAIADIKAVLDTFTIK